MQPLSPFRRDPAPSRLAYRMHRMMLTPNFIRFLRLGLPTLLLSAAVGAYLSDEGRRLEMVASVQDIQRQIAERPEFMVRLMTVEGASLPVTDAIRAAVPLDFPVSSFDIDLVDMQARIAALEAVAAVKVHVRSGGELTVEVIERVPVALWRDAQGLQMIDADGFRVAPLDARADRPDLPLLAGGGVEKQVAEALAILAAAEPIAPRVRGLLRVGERRWDLILDRDQRVMLPEIAPVAALERVIALDEAQDLFEREIALIDMRNPERPTVRVTPQGIAALTEIHNTQAGAD
jgi:cell division protein FtsQ